MLKTPFTPGRPARPRHFRARAEAARKLPSALLLGVLAAAVMLMAPALANADTSSTLTVIGTSDVSDSGLIPNVIQPGFTKAFPQFTFKYIGTGTGNAIAQAESGAAGASNLIVHAASLENQFVVRGLLLRAVRPGAVDQRLRAGRQPRGPGRRCRQRGHTTSPRRSPTLPPPGIERPKATFVSRGGTPGTTVAEHGIWQLVSSSGLSPAGLLLCTVSAANGGGETPIAANHGVTASGQACPNNGALPTAAALPTWYAATGVTQGPNVQLGQRLQRLPQRSRFLLRVHR